MLPRYDPGSARPFTRPSASPTLVIHPQHRLLSYIRVRLYV